MTPYEAHQQASRLTHIWHCERQNAYSDSFLHSSPIVLRGDVFIDLQWDGDEVVGAILSWNEMRLWCQCNGEICCLRRHRPEEEVGSFSDQWLTFFRRSCWLSGLAIDCSAYEKAEWANWFREQERMHDTKRKGLSF